jgi:hypothetical protein
MHVSRNPYHHDGLPPKVLRSAVVYMDVLGYTDMAKQAEQAAHQNPFLIRLHEALRESQEWLRGHDTNFPQIGEKDFYALKAFTDNIVMGWPIREPPGRDDSEGELGFIFDRVSLFQLLMANAGFFVRGAVSLGDTYVDDIVVFGSAFTEAHEGETHLARDPRIVLTKSATEAVQLHLTYYSCPEYSPQNDYLYRDADGQLFLNYLNAVLVAEDELGPDYDVLLQHKQITENRLRDFRSEPRIWSKYAWVANYHNFFCEQYPQHFDDSHKIDWSGTHGRPSRIAG